MKLNLIWIRSTSDAELRGVIDRYFNRIKHFFPIEVTEVAPPKGRQGKSDASIMHADSEKLLSAIPQRGTVVVLDERGEAMTSLKFAGWLEKEIERQPHGIHFVMGGDVGFDDPRDVGFDDAGDVGFDDAGLDGWLGRPDRRSPRRRPRFLRQG